MKPSSDKTASEVVPGEYIFEGKRVTVSVVDGKVVATSEGRSISPIEVVLKGKKVSSVLDEL